MTLPTSTSPSGTAGAGSNTARGGGSSTDRAAEEHQQRMVDQLLAAGHIASSREERALRTVPRHVFLPDAGRGDAYAGQAGFTKSGSDGAALSCERGGRS